MSSAAGRDLRSPVPDGFLRLRADAQRVLDSWSAPDPAQDELRRRYLDHLDEHCGATWRDGDPVHLTAGVLLLDARAEHVLLTLHPKVGLWVQLGGHLEADDADLRAAAHREGVEESGIERMALSAQPVDLHAHRLGSRFTSCEEHLDVRYAGRVAADAQPSRSSESDDLAWWPVDALPADTDPDLPVLVAAAIAAAPPVPDTP